jgi:ring-1,2-phenylacetyl-CoA epoxidase subunit PaaD
MVMHMHLSSRLGPAEEAGKEGPADRRGQALAAIGSVMDPEIPVLSVMDLGMIRFVELSESLIRVGLTPTYSACPAMGVIYDNLNEKLRSAGFEHIEIVRVLDPPWSTADMTAAGRAKLELYGIAPPAGASKTLLFGAPRRCPRCHSTDTECLSEFGSTPCKALYRCRACREPFDYFKCL